MRNATPPNGKRALMINVAETACKRYTGYESLPKNADRERNGFDIGSLTQIAASAINIAIVMVAARDEAIEASTRRSSLK